MSFKKVFIVRGIPGSGKTTLAKSIAKKYNTIEFEADHYLLNKDGKYEYDKSKLAHAHSKCILEGFKHLQKNHTVVFANTFIHKAEIETYAKYMKEHRINAEVYIAQPNFAGKTLHSVSHEVIEQMEREMISIDRAISLFEKYGIKAGYQPSTH
jgi:predicted ATPase